MKPPAYVYFIQAGGPGGPVKIGWTSDTLTRCDRLQIGNHLDLFIIGSYRLTDPQMWEERMHRRFERLLIRGEWFSWDPEIEVAMQELKDAEETDKFRGIWTALEIQRAERQNGRPMPGLRRMPEDQDPTIGKCGPRRRRTERSRP